MPFIGLRCSSRRPAAVYDDLLHMSIRSVNGQNLHILRRLCLTTSSSLADRYGSDAVRWWFLREAARDGIPGLRSVERLVNRINNDRSTASATCRAGTLTMTANTATTLPTGTHAVAAREGKVIDRGIRVAPKTSSTTFPRRLTSGQRPTPYGLWWTLKPPRQRRTALDLARWTNGILEQAFLPALMRC